MNFAGIIYSFNRPSYLDMTLGSIEKGEPPGDWYVLQDGPNAKNHEGPVKRSLLRAQSSSLNPTIISHGENVGITYQFHTAFSLFSKYDYLLIFEDDHIVSKDYVQLILNMAAQFPHSLLQASHTRYHDRFPSSTLNDVVMGRAHLWAYWLPLSGYKLIREKFERLVDIVGKKHRERPKRRIMEEFDTNNAAVDNFVGKSLFKMGIERYITTIPRGKYIGKMGMHMSPEKYKRKGFGDLEKWEYPGDRERTSFNIIHRTNNPLFGSDL